MTTTITVNQLVVGSIPTAGANKSKGVNGLDHRRPLAFVSRKVINSYKLFQSQFGGSRAHLTCSAKRVICVSIRRRAEPKKLAILAASANLTEEAEVTDWQRVTYTQTSNRTLCDAADKRRAQMDAAECKNITLSYLF